MAGMTKQHWVMMTVTLLLLGVVAIYLGVRGSDQRLGVPGVKVVPGEVFDTEGNLAGTNTVPLPEMVLDTPSFAGKITPIELEWLPPDTTYARRFYTNALGFHMQVNVVLMGADRTSIHKPEYCLRGNGWSDHQFELDTIRIEEPHPYDLPVRKIMTRSNRTLKNGQSVVLRGIYVYWFVADGQLTAQHNERMWWMARDMLTQGVLQRWAYVSGFSVCYPGQEDATYELMKERLAAMVPHFQTTTGPDVRSDSTSGTQSASLDMGRNAEPRPEAPVAPGSQ